MAKRLFDFVSALMAVILLSPFLITIAIMVALSSKGPVFYRQKRVGRNNRDFLIFKFRTMYVNSDRGSLLTIGGKDTRITPVGYYLRKYKLDELPQLINVLIGEMSIVGPRPEVRKYVDLYSAEQLRILDVRPGLTDDASLAFSNESDLLALAEDPEKEYREKIMPAKLALNLQYIQKMNLLYDLNLILRTLAKIVSGD